MLLIGQRILKLCIFVVWSKSQLASSIVFVILCFNLLGICDVLQLFREGEELQDVMYLGFPKKTIEINADINRIREREKSTNSI